MKHPSNHTDLLPQMQTSRTLSSMFDLAPAPVVLEVGLDLDGCFYGFDRSYFEAMMQLRPDHACWKTWGGSAEESISGRPVYKPAPTWTFFEDLYGQTYEEFTEVCNEAVDAGIIFSQDFALHGGQAAWDDLLALGHRIHVITARSYGSHPIASQVATRSWLHTGRYRYHSLTFTHDKTAGPRVHIMLEDNLDNYDALNAAGCEVWLLDQPWNQDDGTRRRVYNHDEFVTRVKALAARRAAERVAQGAQGRRNVDLADA